MTGNPRIYGSKWDKARRLFLRAHPLCVMCQQQGQTTAATVVDHIIPHKLKDALRAGDPRAIARAQKLFWDRGNWQGLCAPHHGSTKQRMEKRGVIIGCDENGMPLDPSSHWFTRPDL
ncbi:HNH endonuclease [Shimwellia blattae]|uniref:Putative phage-related protein n=1 Tax=Shimwellia blattae (strain ATCC 29907 / DSM 4481 / JCM 1650 / NBRC 105725 / CDC 9005-74) TaxID=630626 RepID=I2B9F0_SHIBC|nr:HNH endonuclease signature motif containing protein [Shimwellia blattae]AFJ47154.1 putative phage-related protein [Shimwellia blattae DSM 4481 = NBRC 105725]GAB80726.1 putative endonuclease [Shimwellia blattae DSM 4481 = NBRC 105725]VDY64646.1 Uncharacterised protein [Shimwellia blattae]VEC22753.1 Uncharacterised protein [Shimwellia blattae]